MNNGNEILYIIENNWDDRIYNEVIEFVIENGMELYQEDFDMIVDYVVLDDINGISLKGFDKEKEDFGYTLISGKLLINVCVLGYSHFDRDDHLVGSADEVVTMEFSFVYKNGKCDGFECRCL